MHPTGDHLAPAHTERQPAESVDATGSTKPPASCQLTRAWASPPIMRKAKCLIMRQKGGGGGERDPLVAFVIVNEVGSLVIPPSKGRGYP